MFPFRTSTLRRCPHSQYLRRPHIRSSLGGRGISSPKHPYGALQHGLSPLRLSCEIFREEPAISRLDWPFTPIPRSSERFAHQHRFGPPPEFPQASSCPGIDRRASGIPSTTPGEHTPPLANAAGGRFPFGFVGKLLNLAVERNSLAHFSRRTIRRRFPFPALSVYNRLVSGSLHLPSRVLFSFHSRY